MAFVITRLCRDCVDGSCVDACPVEAILEHRPRPGGFALPNQLFIDPELCIHCFKCEPECPWEAIHAEDDVPAAFSDDTALNALTRARPEEFHVPVSRLTKPRPTPDDVERNRARWTGDDAVDEQAALQDT